MTKQTHAVLIHCLADPPRHGGTHVDIAGSHYHFRPDAEGRHVCVVENMAHAERFLAHSDHYRAIGRVALAPEVSPITDAPVPLKDPGHTETVTDTSAPDPDGNPQSATAPAHVKSTLLKMWRSRRFTRKGAR